MILIPKQTFTSWWNWDNMCFNWNSNNSFFIDSKSYITLKEREERVNNEFELEKEKEKTLAIPSKL